MGTCNQAGSILSFSHVPGCQAGASGEPCRQTSLNCGTQMLVGDQRADYHDQGRSSDVADLSGSARCQHFVRVCLLQVYRSDPHNNLSTGPVTPQGPLRVDEETNALRKEATWPRNWPTCLGKRLGRCALKHGLCCHLWSWADGMVPVCQEPQYAPVSGQSLGGL